MSLSKSFVCLFATSQKEILSRAACMCGVSRMHASCLPHQCAMSHVHTAGAAGCEAPCKD